MKYKKLVCGFLVLVLAASQTRAGTVRILNASSDRMSPIFLHMGRSTVIRFLEKPKKVIVGNQNYYGVEFIDNDVTIHPLGQVPSNLFVYTEGHTFGFLLGFGGENYDDLVKVRWAPSVPRDSSGRVKSPSKMATPNLVFRIGGDLQLKVAHIQGPSSFGLHLFDLEIENTGKDDAVLDGLKILLANGDHTMANQKFVVDVDHLKPTEVTNARILVKLESKENLILLAGWKNKQSKISISRRFL